MMPLGVGRGTLLGAAGQAAAGGGGGGAGGDISVINTSQSSDMSAPNATSIACDVPTGVADDDLLIAWVMHREGLGAITAPSGWSLVSETQAGTFSQWLACYTRTASSEPASYTWSGSASSRKAAMMIALTSSGPGPLTVEDSDSQGANPAGGSSSHDIPALTKTSSAGDSIMVTAACCVYGEGGDWSASTGTVWGSTSISSRMMGAYKTASSTGSVSPMGIVHQDGTHQYAAAGLLVSDS